MENSLEKYKRMRNRSLRANLVIILFLLIFVALLNYYNAPSSEAIKLWFIDVGQGDMEYIQLPDNRKIVIDGGPSESAISKLDEIVPAYDRRIDTVILTHPHADHLVGLIKLFKTYEVNNFYFTGVVHTIPEYAEFLAIVKEKNINTHIIKSGDLIDFGNGIRLNIVYPFLDLSSKSVENLNSSSVVARLSWGEKSVLYTGDIENVDQDNILNSGQMLDSDILKIPHHCSSYSSNEKFVEAVSPEYAIISVGADNFYGHPSQACLKLFNNVKIYRTDQDGNVGFEMSEKSIKYIESK